MAGYLHDNILDEGLDYFDANATDLYVCSALPTTYAQATSTYAMGDKNGITVGAPTNASPDGRQCTVSAFTDGDATATGTPTHWAITDGTSILLAANTLATAEAQTSGGTFSISSFAVKFPDP